VLAAPAADKPGRAPMPEPIAVQTVDPSVLSVWGQAFGTWGRTRGDGNAATLDRDSGGFILGADATLGNVTRVGVAGGFQRTTTEVSARLSSGATDSVFAALYGGTMLGPVTLRAGAAVAGQEIAIDRTVSFPGFVDRTYASYDGYTAQAFGELGYRFGLQSAVVEPFVGAAAVRVHRERFDEAGGRAALTGAGRGNDVGFTTLGVRAEWQPLSTPLVLRGMVGWRHAFGDVTPDGLLAFQTATTAPFGIAGVPVARDVLVGEAAVDWRVSNAVTLSLAYTGQVGERAQDHGVKSQFLLRF
jgi:outer membrane autotransporter protein